MEDAAKNLNPEPNKPNANVEPEKKSFWQKTKDACTSSTAKFIAKTTLVIGAVVAVGYGVYVYMNREESAEESES